jgi:hypothetical protein
MNTCALTATLNGLTRVAVSQSLESPSCCGNGPSMRTSPRWLLRWMGWSPRTRVPRFILGRCDTGMVAIFLVIMNLKTLQQALSISAGKSRGDHEIG